MAQEIVWTHPVDGRTNITIPSDNVYIHVEIAGTPAPEDFHTFEENVPTKDDGSPLWRKATIEEIAARDVPLMLALEGITDPVEYHIVDREVSMSTDPYFRDAWVHEKGAISIDMTKAVEVHKKELRQLRAPELLDLDVAYYRALEKSDSVALDSVVARKNALRDVTKHPDIVAAQTPDDLKQAGLSVIKGE